MNRQRKAILRSAACVGAAFAVILSAGNIDSRTATNASFSTQTSLAGISLSLDESYTSAEINVKENEDASMVALDTTDDTFSDTETEDVSNNNIKDTKDLETVDEIEQEPSRFENVGISIADDYVFVRNKPKAESKALGKLYRGCTAEILEDNGDWVKIKSGNVAGYIKKEFLDIGIGVEDMVDEYGTKWARVTATGVRVREKASSDSDIVTLIPEGVRYKVIKEEDGWVKIHINGSEDEFCPDSCNGWVAADLVEIEVEFKHAVSIEEERAEARRKARARRAERRQREWLLEQERQQEDNTDYQDDYEEPEYDYQEDNSYTEPETPSYDNNSGSTENTGNSGNGGNDSGSSPAPADNSGSGNTGSQDSSQNDTGSGGSDDTQAPVGASGAQIAAYAQQFAGGPYVYGGTSLTNGCDCSGLCFAVYRDFGISIPRSSSQQAASGTPVSLDELQPGDLVFYASGGNVNHAALYVGGGQVIQASDYSTGIIYSPVNYRTPYCARRYW